MSGLFNRDHLLVIIGALLVSLHAVDERVRGEELATPFIPFLVLAAIYPLFPRVFRAVAIAIFGAVWFIAQIPGHIIPWIQDGASGSDYTFMFPMIGGAILVGVGLQQLRKHKTP
jgi:hypothetical protein